MSAAETQSSDSWGIVAATSATTADVDPWATPEPAAHQTPSGFSDRFSQPEVPSSTSRSTHGSHGQTYGPGHGSSSRRSNFVKKTGPVLDEDGFEVIPMKFKRETANGHGRGRGMSHHRGRGGAGGRGGRGGARGSSHPGPGTGPDGQRSRARQNRTKDAAEA